MKHIYNIGDILIFKHKGDTFLNTYKIKTYYNKYRIIYIDEFSYYFEDVDEVKESDGWSILIEDIDNGNREFIIGLKTLFKQL